MARQTNLKDYTYYIGADIGFGTTAISGFKVNNKNQIASEIFSFVFPSRLKQGANLVQSLDLGNGKTIENTYTINGIDYTVDGNLDAESTHNIKDYHYSHMQPILLQHGLQLTELHNEDIHLTSGLPIELYYNQNNQRNNANIEQKIANLTNNLAVPQNAQPIKPISINLQPEALGCYFNYIINDKNFSLDKERYKDKLAIIDIGAGTTDIAVVNPNATVDFTRTRSAQIGMLDAIKSIKIQLEKDYGIKETYISRIESMIKDLHYTYRGNRFTNEQIITLLEKAIKPVYLRLKNFVGEVLGSAPDIDRIMVVGGGSFVFAEDIANEYGQLVFIDQKPQLSNARGWAKFQVYQHLKKQKA